MSRFGKACCTFQNNLRPSIDGFNSFKGDAVVIVRGGFVGWANALALNQYNFRSQTIQLPPKY
jgi:hypothetical protein